jgi:hypothetical protein
MLWRCLDNYWRDCRRRERRFRHAELAPGWHCWHDPSDQDRGPDKFDQQLRAIRDALPLPPPDGGIPYRCVLLLAERIELAGLARDRRDPNVSPSAMAERLMPWEPEESGHSLLTDPPAPPVSLGQVWDALRRQADDTDRRLQQADAARELGCSENCWSQWLRRARRAVASRTTASRELFPHWPPRVFVSGG